MAQRHALIVIGGSPPDPRVIDHAGTHHVVICADSGLHHAVTLGLDPDVVVGDMDSVHDSVLHRAVADGAVTVVSPTDKDLTDTELAIEHAVTTGVDAITVVWGGGDRADHVMGVLAAVSSPALDHLEFVRLWIGGDLMHIALADRPTRLILDESTTVSLLPLAGSAEGVTTSGLRWELTGDTLRGDRARGVSNLTTAPVATVSLTDGRLAVIIPHFTSGGLRP